MKKIRTSRPMVMMPEIIWLPVMEEAKMPMAVNQAPTSSRMAYAPAQSARR